MKVIQFPYYSGNIYKTEVIGYITLERFIETHKNPKPHIFNLINKITKTKDKQVKRKLKHKLYSFTPCVNIPVGESRRYDNITKFTGLMQLDFDKIEDEATLNDLKRTLFKDKRIITVYNSPSKNGLKCLLKTVVPTDIEHYRAIFKAVKNYYEQFSYFDEATKNAMLPLFLSYDRDILFRRYHNTETWTFEDWSKPKYVRLNDKKPTNFNSNAGNNDYYLKKTIRIFIDKINRINDCGHPQLRSACLILGSRAAAGYIDLNEAISLAENMVHKNNYLQKGVKGYLSTAKWAVNEGFKIPKYYD